MVDMALPEKFTCVVCSATVHHWAGRYAYLNWKMERYGSFG